MAIIASALNRRSVFLAFAVQLACGQAEEPIRSECSIATVGGLEIRPSHVAEARAASPPPSVAESERLLIEATTVWLSELEQPPSRLDVRAALDAYRAFLREQEYRHAGTKSEWVGAAAREVTSRKARVGVLPGSCTGTSR